MPMHPVLLVDDELTIISGLQQLLSLENIPATIAIDAVSAEKMASDHFYPVVLTYGCNVATTGCGSSRRFDGSAPARPWRR